MKNAITLLTLLIAGICFSQEVNDYKYVVVPEKFEFLKKENQYNLNMLTKMMLEKYGFEVYYANDNKPQALALDKCKALYADLNNDSGLLSTVLTVSLRDCTGKVIFETEKGKSKEKDFKTAYYEALREASRSFDALNYKYSGEDTDVKAVGTTGNIDVKVPVTETTEVAAPDAVLFAQPIPNGYQLVDNTPKVVLRIYKTSKPDSYTAISNNYNGLVFKKGDDWYYEYYDNDKLISQKLNIKF